MEMSKPDTTKARTHQSNEMYHSTKYTHKKLKPGLVAFSDVQPGNEAGLFSKEKNKIREEISKEK